MHDSGSAAKEQLRRRMRAERDRFADHAAASAAVCSRLAADPRLQAAPTLHSFIPMGSEVDLLPLLRQRLAAGVRIAVPVMVSPRRLMHSWVTDLEVAAWQPAPFGTRAPQRPVPLDVAELAALAIVLVPLLAFDGQLHRLGYGGGYYDRFLPLTTAFRFGVAFAFQCVDAVPVDNHDVSLDAVVTEATLIQQKDALR